MKPFFDHFPPCLWMSCALSALLFSPGLVVYFTNASQFNIGPAFLLTTFVIVMLVSSILLASLMAVIHVKAPAAILAFSFACAIDIFLQYNVYSSFFITYGNNYSWTWDYFLLSMTLCLLLLIPFVLAWRFRNLLARNATKIAIVILLSQTVAVANAMLHYKEPNYDFKQYTISEKEKFAFGKEENIIIMVVDCMGEGICKEVLDKYPDLKESLRDFTCFDRMISPLPWTMYAVPAMISGINFPRKDFRIPSDDDHAAYLTRVCSGETSLFMALKKKGFRTEGYPFLLPVISYSPEVLDNSILLYLTQRKESLNKIQEEVFKKIRPFFLQPLFSSSTSLPFLTITEEHPYGLTEAFDQAFHRHLLAESRIGKHPAVFKYLHLQGGHETITIDENMKRVAGGLKYKQLRGSLRNFEELLNQLKKLGLYDNATILLVGDHTECYDIQNIAFVKRRNEHREALVFNSIPCQISDIAGFILKEYGIPTDLPSLYDQPPVWGDGSVRPEQIRYVDFSTWIPCSEVPKETNSSPNDCRMRIDNGAVIFENFIDNRQIALQTTVTLILSQLDGDKKWRATLDYSQRFACLRTSLDSFPDGTYSMKLYHIGLSEDGERIKQHSTGLREIKIQNGKASCF